MNIHTASVLYCSTIAAMKVVMLFRVRQMVTEIKICGTMMDSNNEQEWTERHADIDSEN